MHLTEQQAQAIHALTIQLAGKRFRVWLFSSRSEDNARSDDCDLILASIFQSGHEPEQRLLMSSVSSGTLLRLVD